MLLGLLAALAVLVGAAAQAATGFGFALVAAPALFAVAPPGEAVLATLVLGGAVGLLLLLAEGRSLEVRTGDAGRLIGAGVPGVLLGVAVLAALPQPALQVLTGVIVLAAALDRARPRSARPAARAASAYPVGALGGVLTTATGVNGPPLVLWLRARGATDAELRDTVSLTLLVLSALGAAALAALGAIAAPSTRSVAALAGLLVVAAAGHSLGKAAFARLGPRSFERLVLGLVLLSGAASIATGLL